MTKIAFIGLGNMGGPMAANLVRGGFAVSGYDLSDLARQLAGKSGVAIAVSAIAAARDADIIMTMLPVGADVLAAWGELAPVAKQGAMFIDSSTIDVEQSRAAHELARAAGHASVDAPVSGGIGGAQAGALTFMCGGASENVERARPVLEKMGKKIVHCGKDGAGQAAKICNNMILGVQMMGVCEGFQLGEKLGLTPQALFDVVSTSSAQCWAINSYCPVPGPVPTSPASNDYKAGFATALMLKDMRLSQTAAAALGLKTPFAAEATDVFAAYSDSGHAGEDFSGVFRYLLDQQRRGV
jgi:3-hydroxyisobutyrate dehydrogenase